MPITNEITTRTEEGVQKEAVAFYFTNGAKEQLSELAKHFEQPNELELIKLAISLLQKIKENDPKKK